MELIKKFDLEKALRDYAHLREGFFLEQGIRINLEGKVDRLMLAIGSWNSESFKELVSLMEERGFTVLSYHTQDLDKNGIFHVLDKLVSYTTEDSDLIFFYEGHGGLSPIKDEGSYITLEGSSTTLRKYSMFNMIKPSELKANFDRIPKKRLAVIIDSCFNIDYHDIFSDKDTVVLTAATRSDPFTHYYELDDCHTRSKFAQELIFALESSRRVNLPSLQRFNWWDRFKSAFAISYKNGPLPGTISGNTEYLV